MTARSRTPETCVSIIPPFRRGFTILELLVVAAVIVVLISLTVSAIRHMRVEAAVTQSLSNLRQHGAVFGAYAADYDMLFPYLIRPSLERQSVTCNGISATVVELRYFEISRAWNIPMSCVYYNGDWRHPSFSPELPDARGTLPTLARYLYSNTCIAAPEYWRRETRLSGISQWRPVRQSEVRHSSKKGLLLDYPAWAGYDMQRGARGRRIPVCFMDGSVSGVRWGGFLEPYPNGSGGPPGDDIATAIPTVHTYDGVHGRDVP